MIDSLEGKFNVPEEWGFRYLRDDSPDLWAPDFDDLFDSEPSGGGGETESKDDIVINLRVHKKDEEAFRRELSTLIKTYKMELL